MGSYRRVTLGIALFLPWVYLALFLIIGCSGKKGEDTTQKVIDYGTGKAQVETYQELKKQIRAIHQEETKQFDDTTREKR